MGRFLVAALTLLAACDDGEEKLPPEPEPGPPEIVQPTAGTYRLDWSDCAEGCAMASPGAVYDRAEIAKTGLKTYTVRYFAEAGGVAEMVVAFRTAGDCIETVPIEGLVVGDYETLAITICPDLGAPSSRVGFRLDKPEGAEPPYGPELVVHWVRLLPL